jgi:hypothetical protein
MAKLEELFQRNLLGLSTNMCGSQNTGLILNRLELVRTRAIRWAWLTLSPTKFGRAAVQPLRCTPSTFVKLTTWAELSIQLKS